MKMVNIDVFYYAVTSKGERIVKVIMLPEMPDTLADELFKGIVRPQMRIFLDNLALLQGYEGAEFYLAYKHLEEGVSLYGKS